MADPVGLVSLGLGGAGQLLKVKERMRRRKAALIQLSSQLDEAHKLLVREGRSSEDSVIYNNVLIPPMNAALALLEGEQRRDSFVSTVRKYVRASGHVQEAERLAQILKDAPSKIETQCIARDVHITRINVEVIRANHELVYHNPSAARANHTVALTITISSLVFLTFGEASVTP